MPITCLDPNTALIVVDLQKGIMAMATAHPTGEVARRAAGLAEAFRERGLPVALVNVDAGAPGRTERGAALRNPPAGWTDLIPELKPRPGDLVVTKRTWGAFASTDLHERLKALAVTQVVIAGISTTSGVESTAREAYALGYNVTLAVDPMTDMNAEAHDNSLARIFPKLGETGTSEDILALLANRGV
jgi:nicotinamidase-related amidase